MENKKLYPFTAIVGQSRMKTALILNVINPSLGGVLIRGEKGTAKSTAVRSLADLMPRLDKVQGCKFGCDPNSITLCGECYEKQRNGETFGTEKIKMKVVDLPVSATEDRVVGTLDIEHAIRYGEKKFEKGILAEAHRNILYVDEVNLLDDHVVDVLLDSAAMGVNTIEREGISYSHPAVFTLVGTMNPEEGDLRPQLLDRFGLVVDVVSENESEQRAEVVQRRLDYEADPEAFADRYEPGQAALADKIIKARKLLPSVKYSKDLILLAAKLSVALDVDGHRADIGMIKTAAAIAAFDGKTEIAIGDLKQAAIYVLPHRLRRRPFDNNVFDIAVIDQILADESK